MQILFKNPSLSWRQGTQKDSLFCRLPSLMEGGPLSTYYLPEAQSNKKDPKVQSPTQKKSFSSLFVEKTQSSDQQSKLLPFSNHHGKPALKISKDLVDSVANPFRYMLVGKFSHGRPTMVVSRAAFTKLGLKGDVSLGHFDSKHMLIHLHLEGDFNRIWMREIWHIGSFPVRILSGRPTSDRK